MQVIQTMTAQELSTRMRELGIKNNVNNLIAALEQGLYPFGIAFCPDPRHRPSSRVVQIYTKLFEQWVAERAIEIPDPEEKNKAPGTLANAEGLVRGDPTQ